MPKRFTRRAFVGASVLSFMPGLAAAQVAQEVVIGLPSSSLGAAILRLAHEMGFFAKQGLSTRLIVFESAAVATAALVSGGVKLIQAGPGELIAAQAAGQKVVAIDSGYRGLAQSTVLSKAAVAKLGVNPAAPVAERLKALDGLTIASASATAGATVALKLAAAKMAGVNVRFTYITQATFASAMERGVIDGFIGSAPYSTLAVAQGIGVMWVDGPKGDLPTEFTPANAGLLMVLRPYADANPDTIRRLFAACRAFRSAVVERPGEVKAMVARLFPNLDQQTVDLFFSSESEAWLGGPPTVADMAREIRFVEESGTPLRNRDSLDPAAMVYP